MKNITFIVTHECNLRCTYCYEVNKSSDKEMTFEIGKKCIDYLFESDSNKSKWINPEDADGVLFSFIGGEPLLKIDLIDQIMDYFIKKSIELNHRWGLKYMIGMTSNGVLYHTEKVQRFLKKWDGRVFITITIDGDKETHDKCRVDAEGKGSYNLVSEAFKDIKKNYGLDGTKLTISPDNVDMVFNSHIHMIQEFDVQCLYSNCVFEEGWTYNHATTLYYELKKLTDWLIDNNKIDFIRLSIFDDFVGKPLSEDETQNWCGGTGKMLGFDVNGEILPCIRYSSLSLSNREPLIVGDIFNGIGYNDKYSEIINSLESVTRQSQSTEECINCPIASGCAWCSAYNYEVFGTPNKRATFICPMHKARVLANVYYWNKYYRYIGSDDRHPCNIPDEWALEIISQEELDMLKSLSNSTF